MTDTIANDSFSRRGTTSRRAVLGGLAAASAVLTLTSAAHAKSGRTLGRRARPAVAPALKFADIPGTGDIKVLNYALALEDLEADLYQQAIARLTTGGTNALGVQIKGIGLGGEHPDVRFAKEFGKVEIEHRDFLRAAIAAAGGPVIPMFKYDFNMQNLSRRQVGDLLYTAEQTGVGAYLGAIPFFSSDDSPYVPIAAAILGTEARHTAVIAASLNVLYNRTIPVAPPANQNAGRDVPVPPDTVLAAVSPFIVV
ncbi:MAG TPA: ferritin-like domain-containing protein [Tepidisphaeraceae bacterium]|nr:ferritin-like domain-containing protein [Tepidisphaeraceae bacterium]